ncbi:hypothetical protein BDV93DRAFT_541497 [Ceratobasidium sp. AG-I]|nr:hypothetical protein BDV93DRAFT_541497 [Ceratobasidium sp. AG-I]
MSTNLNQHMSTPLTYFDPDCLDHDFADLLNLLNNLLLPRRRREIQSLPDFPIPPNKSRFTTSWLPENPPMPPGSNDPPFDPTIPTSHADVPTTQSFPSASPESYPYSVNPTFADHTRASDGHLGNIEFQQDHIAHSTGPIAPMVRVQLHRSNIGQLTKRSPALSGSIPTLTRPTASSASAGPPHPSHHSAHISGRGPAALGHARTPSAASSYNSASMPRHFRDGTATSSAPSVVSTESLPTPDTSNGAQDMPWQATHTASGSMASAGGSNSSVRKPPEVDLAALAQLRSPSRALAFSPRATTPPLPIATGATPVQAIAVPAQTTAAPTQAVAALTQAAAAPAQAVAAPAQAIAETRIARPGGDPYVSPEERLAHINRGPGRHYRLYEYGDEVEVIFGRNAPRSWAREAMAAQPKGSYAPIFTRLSHGRFDRSRDEAWLHKHFKIIIGIYRAIRIFGQHYHLERDFRDPDAVLRTMANQLQELEDTGVNLSLHPWHLFTFLRSSWYYWIHARQYSIGDHPSMQTSTRFHSGTISPVSAPSRLPTQLPAAQHVATQSSTAAHDLSSTQSSAISPLSQSSLPLAAPVQPSGPSRTPGQLPAPLRAPAQSSVVPRALSQSSAPSRVPARPSAPSRTPARPSAPSRTPARSSIPLRSQSSVPLRVPPQPSVPLHASTQLSATSRIPDQLAPSSNPMLPPALPHLPQQPQGPLDIQVPDPGTPARSQPPSNASIPRNPSASSLRIPRDPSSGRLARSTVSAGSLSGSHASRASRSAASSAATPTGLAPSQSGSSSVEPAPMAPSPGDAGFPVHAEMIRNQRIYYSNELDIRRWQAQEEERSEWAKVQVAQRVQSVVQHRTEQRTLVEMETAAHRMRLDDERMQLEREQAERRARHEEEQLALERARAEQHARHQEERLRMEMEAAVSEQVNRQVSMYTGVWAARQTAAINAAAALNPQHPQYDNINNQLHRLTSEPMQIDLSYMENQARAVLAQPLDGAARFYTTPYGLLTLGSPPTISGVDQGDNTSWLRSVSPTSNPTQALLILEGNGSEGRSSVGESPVDGLPMEQDPVLAEETLETDVMEGTEGAGNNSEDEGSLYDSE